MLKRMLIKTCISASITGIWLWVDYKKHGDYSAIGFFKELRKEVKRQKEKESVEKVIELNKEEYVVN